MLNFAMVIMILAGILGLPAALCSSACSGIGSMADVSKDVAAQEGQQILNFLMYLSIAASIGSIIVGALVKKLKKGVSGILALVFAGCFALLLIQANMLGLLSALMLLVAAIMIFVAPADQFAK